MNPYDCILSFWKCNSFNQLYLLLEFIAKDKLGLDGVPFPLSALEHPPGNIMCKEIFSFLNQCANAATGNNSEADAIKLIKFLKENPPEKSYENPKLSDSQPTEIEFDLIHHIFIHGIDLPGSMHNPFGHLQYFSSFFIDMFFGNYTESNDYLKTLSKEEVQIALKKREGYCQYSPIFAPILGLKMVDIERKSMFTIKEIQEIRTMYTGCNENKHLKILKKLVKLGADVNAHDINGFTPLHHAVLNSDEGMITVLLKHGANPNSESRIGSMPLSLKTSSKSAAMMIIDILIEHDARLTCKKSINALRTTVESNGTKDLAVKVREAHPREKEECEKCTKPAPKKCSACKTVYYCTPACQKLDWNFHKISCRKEKQACALPTHSEIG